MPKADQIYRLKITIDRSRPAIWRRVEVRSDITLGDLHRVTQGVFAWEESHLHQFVFGKAVRPDKAKIAKQAAAGIFDVDELWGQTVYSDPLFDLENAKDEWAVTLNEAAPAPRTTFVYTYDFGDGWDHQVRVEKIGPIEKGADYPRCTAGAMMAPQEDSGGIWGWEEKVERANDPQEEEDEDIRIWLGLKEGEVLDPTQFDLGETNARMVKVIKLCDKSRKAELRSRRRK
ncbi:MAG: plasmid pRiA4b ORF-3 family protein [Phycisphaerae bacterium]